jgi:hypothetical protein
VRLELLHGQEGDSSNGPYPHLWKALVARLERAGLQRPSRVDLPLAATWGEQLRLVEAHGDRVQFQHSIMQAYLGSRFMDVALTDANFLARALAGTDRVPPRTSDGLGQPGPGREFLMALVFRSRGEKKDEKEPPAGRRAIRRLQRDHPRTCVGQLLDQAEHRLDGKSVDLYATALEIDRGCGGLEHDRIAGSLLEKWGHIHSQHQQGLVEAKLNLVHRFGDVLSALPSSREPAYRAFFDIGRQEPSYAVRLAIAEEIGSGGDKAFDALGTELGTARKAPIGDRPVSNGTEWGRIMCAWLTPMLIGSVTEVRRREEPPRRVGQLS